MDMLSQTETNSAVTVCDHPLVCHNLAVLRDKATDTERFRQAIERIGAFLIQEASKDLPLRETIVETPLCKTSSPMLDPRIPILISPILRAGLMLSDVAERLLPTASTYHIGLYRNEETLQPVTYYNKLPSNLDYAQARHFVLDPMLATGGSAVAAIQIVKRLGVKAENIRFVCVIAAPEGIETLTREHPGVKIITAAVDERLNDKGYIVPGLGDAGDRMFGTV